MYFVLYKKAGLKLLNRPFNTILVLSYLPLFLGYFFEILRNPIYGGLNYGVVLVKFSLLCAFLIYLYNLTAEIGYEKILKYILLPYIYIANFIVISSCIIYIFINFEVIDYTIWTAPDWFGSEFSNRQNDSLIGLENYYFTPYYISVILPNYSKFGESFGLIGKFSGLSYEPHIATYFITPVFFFLSLVKFKYPLILKSFYLLFFILCFSVTNISILLLFLVLMFAKSLFLSDNSKYIMLFGVIILTTIFIFIFNNNDLNIVFEYIKSRVFDNNDSKSTSQSFINYILSPKDIIGNGMIVPPVTEDYDYSGKNRNLAFDNIGYIGSFLFFLYYVIITFFTFRVFFSRWKYSNLSLGLLYFILHSLKFPFHTIGYPHTIYMLFILSLLLYYKNTSMKGICLE
jgi:hypothetical protein